MAHCSLDYSARAENPFYHPDIALAYLAQGVAVKKELGNPLTSNPPYEHGQTWL